MNKLSRRDLIVGAGALIANSAVLSAMGQPLLAAPEAANSSRRSFTPGEEWLDTSGKPIQAHGGSIIAVDDRYYWYGENKEFTTGDGKVWTWGVRCYTSLDLYNWEDLGLIIPPDKDDPNSPLNPTTASLDRPHIIYNSRSKMFVCWIKIMKQNTQTRTVLTADQIRGPYKIVHQDIRPLGMNAGDFDLAVSPDDGKAYMYFERVHSETICADLTDDYTDFTGYYSTHFPGTTPPLTREGQAYFRRNGKHYLATSGMSGYFPNPSQIAEGPTYHGPFTVLGDLHPGDQSRTSFNSQISSVFRHPKKKELYIALADRWVGPRSDPGFTRGDTSRTVQSAISKATASPREALTPAEIDAIKTVMSPTNTSRSRYVWLPISFKDNRPVIEWRSEWAIEEFH